MKACLIIIIFCKCAFNKLFVCLLNRKATELLRRLQMKLDSGGASFNLSETLRVIACLQLAAASEGIAVDKVRWPAIHTSHLSLSLYIYIYTY